MSYDDEMDYLEKERMIYNDFLKNNALELEIGKTYLQESSSWSKMHYKIIFIDDKIAVGVKVWCGIYNSKTQGCGTYEMFKAKTGEKYNDNRLCYRLTKQID